MHITILLLILFSPFISSSEGQNLLSLRTKVYASGKSFRALVNFDQERSCTVSWHASTSRRKVERGNARRIFAKQVTASRASFRTKELPRLALRSSFFIQARAQCDGDSFTSDILQVASSGVSTGERTRVWLAQLKEKSILQAYRLVPAFEALSFDNPVDLQHHGEKLFVVEQPGLIKRIDGASAFTVLDISDRVLSGGERGLLGLAFDPRHNENGYFFVNYTRRPDGATVIARFQISAQGNSDPASEFIIMTVQQPFANHNGGQLAFGSDGFLYIALGDGGSGGDPQNHGQNLSTLLGSILRIDVAGSTSEEPYKIPLGNPFVGGTQGERGEIFAYGLRNPWRFSFDSESGRMWIGDVGQGQLEEVDIGKRGGNYGWRIMEGSECFSSSSCNRTGLELPVAEYGRSDGASITGGYVYRGKLSPVLNALYIYGDFVSGKIWGLRYTDGRATVNELSDSDHNISSFGVDKDGEIYLLSYSSGKIFRIGQK